MDDQEEKKEETLRVEEELSSDQKDEIFDISKRGYRFLKVSLIKLAMDCFRKILEVDPTNNYALVGMGDAYSKEKNQIEAKKFYTECLKHHPRNLYSIFGLARAQKSLGQIYEAIENWEKYLDFGGRNNAVSFQIADGYRRIREFPKAQAVYKKLLEDEETKPRAFFGLGRLNYDFHNFQGALDYWLQMIEWEENKENTHILASIGNCYRRMKDYDKALIYFNRVLMIREDNHYALFGIADCYRGLSRTEEALYYWDKILEGNPQNQSVLSRAGDACRNLKKLKNARDYYTKSMDAGRNMHAGLGLAMISKEEGDFQQALDGLAGIMKAGVRDPRLYIEAADCHEKLEKPEEAMKILANYMANIGGRDPNILDYIQRLNGMDLVASG